MRGPRPPRAIWRAPEPSLAAAQTVATDVSLPLLKTSVACAAGAAARSTAIASKRGRTLRPYDEQRLVVPRRTLEVQPLDLADRAARQPQRGLKALLTQVGGRQPPGQARERRLALVVELAPRRLEEDQVPRPARERRRAHVGLALVGIKRLGHEQHGVTRLDPLCDRVVEQLPPPVFELLLGNAALEQRAHLVQREQRALLLDHPIDEGIGLIRRGRHDHNEAPRRVHQLLGRLQHPVASGDVYGALRSPLTARPLRRPPKPFVLADLDAARFGPLFHGSKPRAGCARRGHKLRPTPRRR